MSALRPKKTLDRSEFSPVITDGEINFLWSFIQGSLIDPDTWNRLLDSYGFCERHAWMYISIEMSFRDQYLLGPTILYQALLEKALEALNLRRFSLFRTIRQLRATDACMLCALNVAQRSAGAAPRARLDRGRDIGVLRDFISDLEGQWRAYVCSECDGRESNMHDERRCRRHLLSKTRADKELNRAGQTGLLRELHGHVTQYQNSFLAGGAVATDQDRAALIGAIGWCSGWRPLLAMLKSGVPQAIDGNLCEH